MHFAFDVNFGPTSLSTVSPRFLCVCAAIALQTEELVPKRRKKRKQYLPKFYPQTFHCKLMQKWLHSQKLHSTTDKERRPSKVKAVRKRIAGSVHNYVALALFSRSTVVCSGTATQWWKWLLLLHSFVPSLTLCYAVNCCWSGLKAKTAPSNVDFAGAGPLYPPYILCIQSKKNASTHPKTRYGSWRARRWIYTWVNILRYSRSFFLCVKCNLFFWHKMYHFRVRRCWRFKCAPPAAYQLLCCRAVVSWIFPGRYLKKNVVFL